MSRGSVTQFLTEAERSGVFAPERSQEVTALAAGDSSLSVEQVASQMVERNILTVFQAEQLLAGRGSECLIAGRYRVLEKLGEGGMGTVYKAQDTNLDRVVAIKVLPAGRLHDADAIARFQREAKALARLSHPHIIQAYDSGSDHGRHFLVMEFVEGLGLDKVLRQHGALPPSVAADFVHQAAVGLEHAHEKGLVHRDLKPANLLMAGTYPQRASKPTGSKSAPAVVKILDLGLARFLQDQMGDRQLTQEGAGMGTPDYMAPEQFRDALNADVRSDIYGLGCTLYHLIGGQVPFPGSSFSEKALAHAKKEPVPLEERCPEVPAGLAVAVSKMMAKHPQDRFQTAGEVALALAPFVAGSSQSVVRLKATGQWQQLSAARQAAGKRPLILAVSAATIITSIVCALLAWPFMFPPANGGNSAELPHEKGNPEVGKNAPPKIVTMENGLTVAKDGTGQYRTITEALEKVESGQTIRVLDEAVYKELLTINRPAHQTGITLEAVRGATLQFPAGSMGIRIINVQGLTIRGFRCTNEADMKFFIGAKGRCQGLRLSSLRMTATLPSICNITLEGIAPGGDQMVVENCTFQGGSGGVRVSGFITYTQPGPCGTILIRDNSILDCAAGILLVGSLKQVCVVGNRVGFSERVGIQLENLLPGTENIWIANNTVFECATDFRYWEDSSLPLARKNIRIRNNLLLKSTDNDMNFIDSGGDPMNHRGAGDGKALLGVWEWGNNWRETPEVEGADLLSKSWIPVAPTDTRQDKIPNLNRDPKAADFLQPAKDSPLATAGAGGDLPAYVGAVPPVGTKAWDWDQTWKALEAAAKVVTIENGWTVAQDGTGQYKTIGEALDKVSPGQTIRVLDNAVYKELLNINRPTSQAGITLEAPQDATLQFPGSGFGIKITKVPRVTLRGFRFTHEADLKAFVVAIGPCQGLRLSSLRMNTTIPGFQNIALEAIAPGGDRMVVENCTIRGGGVGVRLSGYSNYDQPDPCGTILIRENTILDCNMGIGLTGCLKQVCVVGNRVGFSMAGIQPENLLPGTEHIWIANNTFVECTFALRYWDNASLPLARKNIRISNNLMLKSTSVDMIFIDSGGDPLKQRGHGDGKALHTAWQWGNNWRETPVVVGTDELSKSWIPVAPGDERRDEIADVNRDAKAAEFQQPAKDSPLATAGAGGDLPAYVGAVPPAGTAAWDWDRTWKALEKATAKE
ncbi:MAG: protein kinase domain-containing protein [Pirellulaceae bacterium]